MKCENCHKFKNGDCTNTSQDPCIDVLEKAVKYFNAQINFHQNLISNRQDDETREKLSEKLNIFGNAKIACEIVLASEEKERISDADAGM